MNDTTATPLWPHPPKLDQLNALHRQTLAEGLGMLFTEVGRDYLRMTMPVDARTKQPMGLLHGGASAALAETIGSVASYLIIDAATQAAVGLELNCSHLRGESSGVVTATCRALRIGRSMHVWDVQIHNEQEKLVCVSRLTVTIVEKTR